jgi:hypothetical protein
MSFLAPESDAQQKKAFVTFGPGPFELLSALLLLTAVFVGVALPLIRVLRGWFIGN